MVAKGFKGTQSPRAGPGACPIAQKSFKLTNTQPREEVPGQRAIRFLRRLAFNWLQVASALSAACQGRGAPFMSPTSPFSTVPPEHDIIVSWGRGRLLGLW